MTTHPVREVKPRSRYPFGSEYGAHPRWSWPEGWYIRQFGAVDLPSHLRARIIIQALREMGGNIFLDVGSGTGNYSFFLSRDDSNTVWGMDVDGQRVQDCKRIASSLGRENVHFCTGSGDVGIKAFANGSLDAVLAVEVLQYVPNISLALKEALRVLKPGGSLVGHVPVLGYLRDVEKNLFDDDILRDLLTSAGFEIVSLVRTFGGNIRRLCRIFDWASRRSISTALIFPILLAVSRFLCIESPDGDYRLFVARKPLE